MLARLWDTVLRVLGYGPPEEPDRTAEEADLRFAEEPDDGTIHRLQRQKAALVDRLTVAEQRVAVLERALVHAVKTSHNLINLPTPIASAIEPLDESNF